MTEFDNEAPAMLTRDSSYSQGSAFLGFNHKAVMNHQTTDPI